MSFSLHLCHSLPICIGIYCVFKRQGNNGGEITKALWIPEHRHTDKQANINTTLILHNVDVWQEFMHKAAVYMIVEREELWRKFERLPGFVSFMDCILGGTQPLKTIQAEIYDQQWKSPQVNLDFLNCISNFLFPLKCSICYFYIIYILVFSPFRYRGVHTLFHLGPQPNRWW